MSIHMDLRPRRVVIAGGGIGALEAVLALRSLSDGQLAITVVAPNKHLTLPPLTVAEPFAAGHADIGRLADILREEGATLHQAAVVGVDPDRRVVACSDGDDEPYDALVVATGARPRQAYDHTLTFGLGDPLAYNGLLADLEHGYTDSVAFVVPDGVSWSLPLYELALLTARQVWGMGRDVELTLVTPEPAPLAIFGTEAAAAVRELFDAAGIALVCGSPVALGLGGHIHLLADDSEIVADRVVSLPLLEGPRIPGLPADAAGFVPIDGYCRVPGLEDVYAIGDAADLLVKQGGLACQQADVAAAHIAAAAGADVEPTPLRPVLRGRLLTGATDQFLRRDLGAPHGSADPEPLWWPPAKVAGLHLGPWLAARGLVPSAMQDSAPEAGVDVEVDLGPMARLAPDVLGLEPLGPMRSRH